MATLSSILAWRIPMDRGAWWATVHRVTKSWTQLKQLSMHPRACSYCHFVNYLGFVFVGLFSSLPLLFPSLVI